MTSAVISPNVPSVLPETVSQAMAERDLPAYIAIQQEAVDRWEFAATANAVFFSVISIGGLIATAVFASPLIPIAIVAAASAVTVAAIASGSFFHFANKKQHWVDELNRVNHFQVASQFALATPQLVQQALAREGVVLNPLPEDLTRLKRMLSLHQLGEISMNWSQQQAQEMLQGANTLARTVSQNYGMVDSTAITEMRYEALKIEENALQYKILTAYCNAMLRSPNYPGTLNNVGIYSLNVHEGAHPSNEVFTFWNHIAAPITLNELRNSTIVQLGQRLVAGMI